MNIDLKIKLPLISIEDNSTSSLIINTQLMLEPFYATEADVVTPFTDIPEEHFPWIRKTIFNSSITVQRLTSVIEKMNIMSEEDLLFIRRDFVICLVTNELAKQLNKDLAASIARSKSLGDFSVSTSTKGDSSILLKIISDSGSCITEMKKLIKDIELSNILPKSFVKGRSNISTIESNRLWWHSELNPQIRDGYASSKYSLNNRKYKAGGLSSPPSLFDYYKEINEEL